VNRQLLIELDRRIGADVLAHDQNGTHVLPLQSVAVTRTELDAAGLVLDDVPNLTIVNC